MTVVRPRDAHQHECRGQRRAGPWCREIYMPIEWWKMSDLQALSLRKRRRVITETSPGEADTARLRPETPKPANRVRSSRASTHVPSRARAGGAIGRCWRGAGAQGTATEPATDPAARRRRALLQSAGLAVELVEHEERGPSVREASTASHSPGSAVSSARRPS